MLAKDVEVPGRDASKGTERVVQASDLGLEGLSRASVIIPPAVSHEIGADALAMLLMTGAMEQDEPCVVVDYAPMPRWP